jgi:hypothetical protein
MEDHKEGRVSRTRNLRPLRLIHYEYFENYSVARAREMYLKSGAGREWLQRRLFKGTFCLQPEGLTADPA